MPKDPKGILKQVAGFGYKEIEGYEGDKGMFWGMSHTGFKKYPNRFSLCHVKDRIKGADPKEEEASCDLGTGSIDHAKILRVAADNGMKHYIMEQERYDNSNPLKSAEAGADYLIKLLI